MSQALRDPRPADNPGAAPPGSAFEYSQFEPYAWPRGRQRPDWLEEPSENLIEITPEQGIALSLSGISQSLKRFVGGEGQLGGA